MAETPVSDLAIYGSRPTVRLERWLLGVGPCENATKTPTRLSAAMLVQRRSRFMSYANRAAAVSTWVAAYA